MQEVDETQEEGWITVGQRVPVYFEAETRYRQGSCMPWLVSPRLPPGCLPQHSAGGTCSMPGQRMHAPARWNGGAGGAGPGIAAQG
jgi:hypothetical protein